MTRKNTPEENAAAKIRKRENCRRNSAIYRERHPERVKAYEMKYRAEQPEAMKAKRLAYKTRNPERYKAVVAAWRNANKVRLYAKRMARKLKKRRQILDYLEKIQKGRCAICRQKIAGTPHIDHIIPRAMGGSSERSNLQLTCAHCNVSKGAKDPILYAREIGRLI